MVDVKQAMDRLMGRFKDTICLKYGAEMEQWAKDNAPWTDRTGDARRMLKGGVVDREEEVGVFIAHRKEYGKYLEVTNSGKYAILKPTIEQFREGFFNAAKKAFGG